MDPISYDAKVCRDLNQALRCEWLEKNSFGGFASSSIISVNTYRHHGLLVAQLKPPLGQFVLLSGLEEILYIADEAYPLSTMLFRETVYPEGYRHLKAFSMRPFPTWVFEIEDVVLVKNVVSLYDEQTVLVRYRVIAGDEFLVRLELRPLTVFRDVRSLGQRSGRLNTAIETAPGRIRFAGVYFYHNAAIVDQSGAWYRGVYYPGEKQSGRDFQEDLYAPFHLICPFLSGNDIFLCASLEDRKMMNPQALIAKEDARRYQSEKSNLSQIKGNAA